MQTPEALKAQIDSATDLQSVIKTMKALAAVSIQQYESAIEALRDYSCTIELGLQILLSQPRYKAEKLWRSEYLANPEGQLGLVVFWVRPGFVWTVQSANRPAFGGLFGGFHWPLLNAINGVAAVGARPIFFAAGFWVLP